GKDSLYNESPLGPVTPTLLITALGMVPDVRKTVSVDLKEPGNLLYLLGETYPELGGSEYYKLKGFIGKSVPQVRPEAKRTMEAVTAAIDAGYIKSCHDLSEGGLGVAVAEMAFTGGHGTELYLERVPRSGILRDDHLLFSESNSRFLVEVPERFRDPFETLAKGVSRALVGRVKGENRLHIHGLRGNLIVDVSLAELRKAWKGTLGG
ncbi:MAG: AIR synthase-related protein, partial [Candidatus Bathyarchaeia archaeon]